MFTCWCRDGSAGRRVRPPADRAHGAWYWAALVRRRRAAAARHRVGGAGPRRSAPRQGPRAVGRAHVRRPDGAVDGRQRDVRDRARRSRRRARPRLRHARARSRSTSSGTPPASRRSVPDGYAQDGVVHGIVELAGGPLHLTEAPARRWHRWGDELARLELPRRLRPHRAAGAVRVPRRHRRRLGAHSGRLAVRARPTSTSRRDAARRTRRSGHGQARRRARGRARPCASAEDDGIARRARTRTTPPANAPRPRRPSGGSNSRGRRRRATACGAATIVDRQRRHRDPVLELPLRRQQLLELGLAVGQLGLDPHDRVDVGRRRRAARGRRSTLARWLAMRVSRSASCSVTSSASWSKDEHVADVLERVDARRQLRRAGRRARAWPAGLLGAVRAASGA